MSYKCEILADSIGPQGNRLTTFKVTYPRIIHAEMCRHRILSRNTASSRAIPFDKMVKDVQKNPFIPLAFQRDHKGMQGTEYIIPIDNIYGVKDTWLAARDKAIELATSLNKQEVTKQLCNRLLEPFVWTTELVSGTEWNNFFSLRCPQYSFGKNTENPRLWKSRKDAIKDFPDWESRNDFFWQSINDSQAEIHIQKIAEMMWDCYNTSRPETLKSGEWHIPYGNNMNMSADDSDALWQAFKDNRFSGEYEYESVPVEILVATARAARISYTTFGDNPKIDYKADIKLHDKLLESKHLSCFEHCAKVMSSNEYVTFVKGQIDYLEIDEPNAGEAVAYNKVWNHDKEAGWCNNFRGFINYRYLIEDK